MAWHNLGVSYGKLGRHPEAVEALREGLRLKPDHAEACYNLGVSYIGELGRWQEAAEALREGVRLKPDSCRGLVQPRRFLYR
jgi:tetratricopeptide (TPR) repeat protein